MVNQEWAVEDVFMIPLDDGTACLGQVVGREAGALNSVSIAIFDRRDSPDQLEQEAQIRGEDIFSIVFVPRDLLDSGRWRVIGEADNILLQCQLPFENLRRSGFAGATVFGSENIESFLNAFYGLRFWNDSPDSLYFDRLLLSPEKKPTTRILIKPA